MTQMIEAILGYVREPWHNFKYRIYLRAFFWLGARIYPVCQVYHPNGTEDERGELFAITAVHFADSERELNCSMRDHVEALDESYMPTPTEEQALAGMERREALDILEEMREMLREKGLLESEVVVKNV